MSEIKPWIIQCCGCGRLMASTGTTLEFRPGLIFSPEIAAFETTAAADVFAAEHGWIVADAQGPNHRCPKCPNRSVGPRGGYLNRFTMLDLWERL